MTVEGPQASWPLGLRRQHAGDKHFLRLPGEPGFVLDLAMGRDADAHGVAEAVRFELTETSRPRRFSRPLD